MHPVHDLPDVCGACGSTWNICACEPTPLGPMVLTPAQRDLVDRLGAEQDALHLLG